MTGALQVAGGVGIGGDLYVGGTQTTFNNAIGIGKTPSVFDGTSRTLYGNISFVDIKGWMQIKGVLGGGGAIDFQSAGSNYRSAVIEGGNGYGNGGSLAINVATDTSSSSVDSSGVFYKTGLDASSVSTATLVVRGGTFIERNLIVGSTTSSISAVTGALTVAGGVGIGGDLFVGGGIAGYAPLDSPIFEGTAQFSTATFTGTVTMQQSTEKFVTASPVAGAVALNFNQAAIFVVTPDNSNFIADFLNIPGTAGRTITTALILTQGSTPYIPNAVKINGGSSITPKWLGGSEPTGTANCTEIVSFIFVCIATNTWTVLGSLSSYGTAG